MNNYFSFHFSKTAKSFIICVCSVVVFCLHIQHVEIEDKKNSSSSQTKGLNFCLVLTDGGCRSVMLRCKGIWFHDYLVFLTLMFFLL